MARCRCTHFARLPCGLRVRFCCQQPHSCSVPVRIWLVCFRHRDTGFVISRYASGKFAPAVKRHEIDGLAEATIAEGTGIGADDDSTGAGHDGDDVAATDQRNAADIDC
jgi:hypothetical protein